MLKKYLPHYQYAKHSITILLASVAFSFSLSAQDISLGSIADFSKSLQSQVDKRKSDAPVSVQLPEGKTLSVQIKYSEITDEITYAIGNPSELEGNYYARISQGGEVRGHVILDGEKYGYQYYDENGEVFIKKVDADKLLCIGYDHNDEPEPSRKNGEVQEIPTNLQSLPGANGCLYLDFDGQYVANTPWEGGAVINAAPAGMSDGAIQEAWEIISEDFRPFSINVTTNEGVFNSYPKNRRMRCIYTPTNFTSGAGGVAYVGSFAWNDDTPCWVFILSGKAGGEAGASCA